MVTDVLDQIEENQRRFEEARSTRRRYALCVENERLFAQLGITFPPLRVPGGLWWLRRQIVTKAGKA